MYDDYGFDRPIPRTSGGCRPTWPMVSISDPLHKAIILNDTYPLILIFYQSESDIISSKTWRAQHLLYRRQESWWSLRRHCDAPISLDPPVIMSKLLLINPLCVVLSQMEKMYAYADCVVLWRGRFRGISPYWWWLLSWILDLENLSIDYVCFHW